MDHVDLKGFLILIVLTMLWGHNYPAVKISNISFSPIFNAFLRSVIASVLGIVYYTVIKE
jgi:drug/metabolite transporter (DMT)-like permease